MADIKMINKKTSSLQISYEEQQQQQQDPPSDQQHQQQHRTNNNNHDDPEDLQRFTHWDDNGEPTQNEDVGRGGWSVEDMFRTNQNLGVQSTFKDDLTQYTTVPVEGSKEDRARAAKIAKEIEANEKSKRMAYLENDDEERDLDKETIIPDEIYDSSSNQAYHQQKRHSRGSRGNNKSSFQPQRNAVIVPENHRANALRDPPPPPRNRQFEHGRQRDRGNYGSNNKTYQPGPSNLNNSSNIDSNSNQQQPPPQTPPAFPQQQQLQGDTTQKSQNFNRRKEDLKSWQNNFNAAYRQNSQTSGTTSPQKTPVSPPVQQQQDPPLPSHPKTAGNLTFQQQPQPTATIYPPRPTNAWQKGPPDFSSHQAPQQQHQPQSFVNTQISQALPNTITSTVTHQQAATQSPPQGPSPPEPQGQDYEAPADPTPDTAQSEPEQQDQQLPSSENSTTKFQFNPDAPAFVPQSARIQTPLSAPPPSQSVPIVSMAQQPQQQHYITAQPFQPTYATHIPQSLTNTLPPGYILTTQNVGMQHNPNMIHQQTFIPQQISYVPAGVPIYSTHQQQQIMTSVGGTVAGGGGYTTFIPQQQHLQNQQQAPLPSQTFVVRSNYDLTNPVGGGSNVASGGYSIQNPQQQQIQYATIPMQYQPQPLQFQQQQPQHFQQALHQPLQQQQPYQQQQQPQLPYSQPPPQNRRYGQN